MPHEQFINMTLSDLYKNINVQKIAKDGFRLYEEVRSRYEPEYMGKYLAIEVDSGDVYLGNTGVEAIFLAKQKYPEKIFYLVKIGFDSPETLAKTFGYR